MMVQQLRNEIAKGVRMTAEAMDEDDRIGPASSLDVVNPDAIDFDDASGRRSPSPLDIFRGRTNQRSVRAATMTPPTVAMALRICTLL
jgi:hypothetical protein